MKVISLLIVLFVTGCVTTPIAKTINPDCDKVARFAKGMAMMKETGLTEPQLQQHISVPTIQPFPITLIRKQIYADNLNDQQAYDTYYSKCIVVGYKQLLSIMEDEDELARLANENATLIEETSALAKQLDNLKTKPKQQALNPVRRVIAPPPPQKTWILTNQQPIVKEPVVRVYGPPTDPYYKQ